MNYLPSHGESIITAQTGILHYKHQLREKDLLLEMWISFSATDAWHDFADQCCQQMSVLSAAELESTGKEMLKEAQEKKGPPVPRTAELSSLRSSLCSWRSTHSQSNKQTDEGTRTALPQCSGLLKAAITLKSDWHQIRQLSFNDSFMAKLLWWSLILWIREKSSVP